jgi:NPCBM/NEW2 domain
MFVLSFVICCFAAQESPATTAAIIKTLAAPPRAASSFELDVTQRALATVTAEGAMSIPLRDVTAIEFASGESTFEAEIEVELVDGSRFAARLADSVEDSIAMDVPAIGRVVAPLEVVRGVAFGDAAARAAVLAFDKAAGNGEDVVTRRGKSEGDRVSGTIIRIGREGVVVANDLGELVLAPRDVMAATLATDAGEVEDDGAPRIEVDLRDGGRMRGALRDLRRGELTIGSLLGEATKVATERIDRIRIASDRFDWLSDLTPSKVEETPYFGDAEDFLFPWRRDLSVTGKPLASGGLRFGKGIGLHSRARLKYDLGGAYSAFSARAGVCDEVARLGLTGSTVLRVYVDGALAFESAEMVAGAAPLELPPIALNGKQALEIEVDYGKGGDIGDRVALLDPLLVRD